MRWQMQTSFFPIGLTIQPSLRLAGALRKRQPPVDLPDRIDIAGAVFINFRELAGAVVGMFGEKDTTS